MDLKKYGKFISDAEAEELIENYQKLHRSELTGIWAGSLPIEPVIKMIFGNVKKLPKAKIHGIRIYNAQKENGERNYVIYAIDKNEKVIKGTALEMTKPCPPDC